MIPGFYDSRVLWFQDFMIPGFMIPGLYDSRVIWFQGFMTPYPGMVLINHFIIYISILFFVCRVRSPSRLASVIKPWILRSFGSQHHARVLGMASYMPLCIISFDDLHAVPERSAPNRWWIRESYDALSRFSACHFSINAKIRCDTLGLGDKEVFG